jgi:hypothetical protein
MRKLLSALTLLVTLKTLGEMIAIAIPNLLKS